MIDKISHALRDYQSMAILKDGSSVNLRAIHPEDIDKLIAFFNRLSQRTVFLRFHYHRDELPREEAKELCTLDYKNKFAIVATIGEGAEEKFIGVGRYNTLPKAGHARLALTVEDIYQGKGVGTTIIEQLANAARSQGIRAFEVEALAESPEALKVLEDVGFKKDGEVEKGIYRMLLPLESDSALEKKSAQREEKATIASLKSFLTPRSVAVIGASSRPTALGHRTFTCLLYGGFKGTAYPINPKGEPVAAVKAYPSILDVPGEVDLAVIVVPADAVQPIVEQCGRKGVRGIVVISAGFGESGPDGVARQNKLLATVRSYGMRMVGPNCMGIINTAPDICMNASFSQIFPPNGRIAFGTQSGGLGLAILEYAKNLNIGISTFVSIGNRADVSSNDLLQYWKEDPATDVILLYLESFGNPKKFAQIARNVTVCKPVVVVKSGRTAAGARAAASHTGALASAEVAAEALFKQAGIIRVNTLEELFDTAIVLANQPVPRGRKVAIITNGGGPGILTADACADKGLEVPVLSEKTRGELKSFLSPQASVSNPVDMTADASYDEYKHALQLLLQDNNVDIAIAILVSPVKARTEFVAKAIREVAPEFQKAGKTLISSFMGQHGVALELVSNGEIVVPSFSFPEASAIAIAKACEYGEWLKKPKGNIPYLPNIDREKAQAIIKSAQEKEPVRPFWLNTEAVAELLHCYGVQTVPSRIAKTAQEAARFADELGYPVALKLYSETITHKTEVGGVMLNLLDEQQVKKAYANMKENLNSIGRGGEMQGVTVQPMIASGTEMIVGVTQDPSFGPLVLFGMGGIYTELFKDISMRIHPLTDVDAREMVRSVKAFQLLEGWRGSKKQDIASIEELLLRVSAMVEDIDQIKELDLNPVKVQEAGKGYVVVDARIMIA